MSIAIHADLDALNRLTDRLIRFGKLADSQRTQLMDELGAEVVSQTQRRIDSEKQSPDGEPWAPWSENYANTRKAGHSLLMADGHLSQDIHHQVIGDAVEIGSNLAYAAAHQFGLDMSVISTGKHVQVPARPYLGLSEDNLSDLELLVDDFVDRQLEAL